MGLTLKDLDRISADRQALSKNAVELQHQMQRFLLLDEDMTAALAAVNETLELLGRLRRAVTNIGEAAQAQQIMESSQNGQSRFSNRDGNGRG